jgi:hypothetical protein
VIRCLNGVGLKLHKTASHLRSPAIHIAIAVTLVAIAGPTAIKGQSSAVDHDSIRVRINAGKRVTRGREPIAVEVEIKNIGKRGVFICSGISSDKWSDWPCVFRLWLEDSNGKKVQALEPDLPIIKSPRPEPETPLETLTRQWVGLQSQHALKGAVKFFPDDNGNPPKAGQYVLRGDYYSYGLSAPGSRWSNVALEDLPKLPFPVLQGRVKTNSVPITIIPAK